MATKIPMAEPPVAMVWDIRELVEQMLGALEHKGFPVDRLFSGRVVTLLATPSQGTASCMAVGHSAIPPGSSTEEHTHTSEEVAIVLGGSGWAEIDGSKFPIREGSIVFTPSGAPHQTRSDGEIPLLVLWICAPPGSESRWLPPGSAFLADEGSKCAG